MLNYNNFLLETKLSQEKEDFHLELNNKGKTLEPFIYYYRQEIHDNFYFVLKNINYDEYVPENNRVTLLSKTTYKDTDSIKDRNKLLNTNFDENNYYFYILISTRRRPREIHGSTVSYLKEPNRFTTQRTHDGKLHFIVIEKNDYVTSIRINAGPRTAAGDRAEKQLADKFGLIINQTKMSKKILKRDIIPENNTNSILFDILGTEQRLLDKYKDLFYFEDPDEELNKYDLIIPYNNELEGKKIEVKKYSITSIIDRNGNSKPIDMAEQLKISNKYQLKNLINLYQDVTGNNVDFLIDTYNDDGGIKINNLFKINYNGEHIDLINEIRNFYNARLNYMFRKYRDIPYTSIMKGVYGIYFFNVDSGIDGFLIQNKPDNIKYYWEIIPSHWGLNRIKLKFLVNPESYRMVWLGDENKFIRTFKVKDIETSKRLKIEYIKTNKRPIIKNTELNKPIIWNTHKGYWEYLPDNFELNIT